MGITDFNEVASMKNLEGGTDDLFVVLRLYTQQKEIVILSQNCR